MRCLVQFLVLLRIGRQRSDDRNQGRKKAATGVSVTWVDVQSVLLQILGTLDACSTSSAYGVTACFPIIHRCKS